MERPGLNSVLPDSKGHALPAEECHRRQGSREADINYNIEVELYSALQVQKNVTFSPALSIVDIWHFLFEAE